MLLLQLHHPSAADRQLFGVSPLLGRENAQAAWQFAFTSEGTNVMINCQQDYDLKRAVPDQLSDTSPLHTAE